MSSWLTFFRILSPDVLHDHRSPKLERDLRHDKHRNLIPGVIRAFKDVFGSQFPFLRTLSRFLEEKSSDFEWLR